MPEADLPGHPIDHRPSSHARDPFEPPGDSNPLIAPPRAPRPGAVLSLLGSAAAGTAVLVIFAWTLVSERRGDPRRPPHQNRRLRVLLPLPHPRPQ